MASLAVKAVAPSLIDRIKEKIDQNRENQTEEQVRGKLEAEFYNLLGLSKSDYEKIGKEGSSAGKELMDKLGDLLKKAGEKLPDAFKAGVAAVGTEVLGSQTMVAVEQLIAMVSAPPLSVLIAAAGLSAFVVAKIVQIMKSKDKEKHIEEITQIKDNVEKAKAALESIMPEMIEKYKSSSKADFKKELSQKVQAIFKEYGIPYTMKTVEKMGIPEELNSEQPKAQQEQAANQEAAKLNEEQAKKEEEERLKEQMLEAEAKASLGGE